MYTYINYWDMDKAIEVICTDEDISFCIKNGDIEFEWNGVYGATNYFQSMLLYDLCGLIALWEECYGQK